MPNPVFKSATGWWWFEFQGFKGGPFLEEDKAWAALREYIESLHK